MDIIVNHSSMQPIYEQIGDQIKEKIMHGILKADTPLPSVRTLAKELKVSALTVKKAYDALEEEGFVITIHGKGSFVAFADQGLNKIPDKVTDRQALFVGDVLATGYWAARISEITEDDTVLIIGAGPTGICTLLSVMLKNPNHHV